MGLCEFLIVIVLIVCEPKMMPTCVVNMLQDGIKKDFLGKFDAVWLGPYIVKNIFLNNSVQLETLNGQSFPT